MGDNLDVNTETNEEVSSSEPQHLPPPNLSRRSIPVEYEYDIVLAREAMENENEGKNAEIVSLQQIYEQQENQQRAGKNDNKAEDVQEEVDEEILNLTMVDSKAENNAEKERNGENSDQQLEAANNTAKELEENLPKTQNAQPSLDTVHSNEVKQESDPQTSKIETPNSEKGDEGDKFEDDEPEEEEEVSTDVKFKVKTPAGKEYLLNQHETSTIMEIKEMLVKMNDSMLEPDEIKLIFKGKPLNDTLKTIKEAGITQGSTLHMIKQLYGASSTPNKKVGAKIERTEQGDRGFIHITIPQGARPGNRLIIHPPGRSRMIVYVPRGHGPGDQLRVQLPSETPAASTSTANNQTTNNSNNRNQNQATRARARNRPTGIIGPTVILKAICPSGARPGKEILVNVPGNGVMKVAVPPTAQQGQPFYFRVVPTFPTA